MCDIEVIITIGGLIVLGLTIVCPFAVIALVVWRETSK